MEKEVLNESSARAVLALLRCAMHGGTAELPDHVDWQDVLRLAGQQQVLPLVMEVAGQSRVRDALPPSAMSSAVLLMMSQTRKTARFIELYRSVTAPGLKPLVLKGLVCRSLYPQPDLRPSSDEDLLIEAGELQAFHKALERFGMHCEYPELPTDLHEITYVSPHLHIELHTSLFPPESSAYGDLNDLFEGVFDRAVTIETEGSGIRTLSPTDHLLYLICHAFKHFIHSGVGIRQVCDIGMLSEHFAGEINWDHVRKGCDQHRIARFAAALYTIAERHLGFTMPEAFADLTVDESDLLRDILTGGIYGTAEENRLHSATITLEAAAAQKHGRKNMGLLASVFLPLRSMREKYPYLVRNPWLLPAAWVQRVGQYLLQRRTTVSPAASIRIGNERVRLLRKYGIIE